MLQSFHKNWPINVRFKVLTAVKISMLKITFFWDVAPCSLADVYRRFGGACCLHRRGDDGAGSTSETSVNFYQTTRRNVSENSHHTRRRENLKSHVSMLVFWVVTPCGLVGRYQHLGGTYCHQLYSWIWRQCLSHWWLLLNRRTHRDRNHNLEDIWSWVTWFRTSKVPSKRMKIFLCRAERLCLYVKLYATALNIQSVLCANCYV
jgi:hypothetical protein